MHSIQIFEIFTFALCLNIFAWTAAAPAKDVPILPEKTKFVLEEAQAQIVRSGRQYGSPYGRFPYSGGNANANAFAVANANANGNSNPFFGGYNNGNANAQAVAVANANAFSNGNRWYGK